MFVLFTHLLTYLLTWLLTIDVCFFICFTYLCTSKSAYCFVIHSLTHSLTHILAYSITYLLAKLLIYLLTHSLNYLRYVSDLSWVLAKRINHTLNYLVGFIGTIARGSSSMLYQFRPSVSLFVTLVNFGHIAHPIETILVLVKSQYSSFRKVSLILFANSQLKSLTYLK